jgi:small subunit ribosomal protein S5
MAEEKIKPKKAKEEKFEAETEIDEEKLEVEKDIITEIPEVEKEVKPEVKIDVAAWKPKTALGAKVKKGEITDVDQVFEQGLAILEDEITDVLMPEIQTELLMVGQSKGKFGGGSRRIFKQTQKKTPEGNKPSFACMAVVGNVDGYVGLGYGKSKDTVPSREKAIRNAKKNIFKIKRGCGSWQCSCQTPHSLPFAVEGKCGSVRIRLMPAPKGKGLCVEPECAKILRLAGIKDVWSKTFGQTRVKINLAFATIAALKKLVKMKINPEMAKNVGLVDGRIKK